MTCARTRHGIGVEAGMPLRAAARKCPPAIFLPLETPRDDDASERPRSCAHHGYLVEVWGWDVAFVGAQTDEPEHWPTRSRTPSVR